AAPAEGMRVLTYAMALDKARAWLEIADEAGAEAHSLIPEAGPMARLVERLPSLAAVRAQGPIVVIDLGHARTDVVVVHGGRAIYARALARAGKHLTEAVARQWRLGWPEAEQAKHTDGFVASTAMPATSKAWARVSEVMTAELNPLARELRQTLAACRAKTGAVPAGALLVGGGSRLRGLPTWLGEQLGLPIVTIADGDAALLTGPKLAGQVGVEGGALALGMVIDAEAARPLLDLRQGPLAHEVDLTFLRTKAVALSAAVVAITAAATISAWVHHAALRKAQRVLDERLAIESTEEFGDPKTADEILSSASGQVAGAVSPLPKMTAWDTLLDISNRMPAHDKITLDVDTIDIDPSKILFKGTAMTPDEVDAIEAALKAQVPNEQPCYVEVNRGATQQVGDKRQFEFTIKPACM
ncbi:MAG: pilus assembly protein PilM, partial [Myxococcales bacterium]|nr:pilus assembly protein PilM [Myxococcales bacterium]